MEEQNLREILDQIIESPDYKITEFTSMVTSKWSDHGLCHGMEFLFKKDKEIQIMKSPTSPSWVIRKDHQLSVARWLKKEVPEGNLWANDQQILYSATVTVGKSQIKIVAILSLKLEEALEGLHKRAA